MCCNELAILNLETGGKLERECAIRAAGAVSLGEVGSTSTEEARPQRVRLAPSI